MLKGAQSEFLQCQSHPNRCLLNSPAPTTSGSLAALHSLIPSSSHPQPSPSPLPSGVPIFSFTPSISLVLLPYFSTLLSASFPMSFSFLICLRSWLPFSVRLPPSPLPRFTIISTGRGQGLSV